MKIFSPIYNKMMQWAQHPHAEYYLGILSFAESSFFPIPPDVMLAPMVLANPKKGWWLALLTTVTSTLGGLFGYIIGMFFFALVHPLLVKFGYWHLYLQVHEWFNHWGFWIIFVAGFSPLPYKVFTIAAGTLHIAILPFTIASFIGRGSRFFLVAWLMKLGGEKMEGMLRRYIDTIGWATVFVIVICGFVYYRWR
jgi:membrane protein YqaA with SNARE-associated domain